jgi:transcriptional regulator with XRE-family HTH domain
VLTATSADVDTIVATRVRERRVALALTINELAKASGVSRAMISRIERREVSPTATLLARLTNALGLPMSALFESAVDTSPIRRAADRPVWQDPASGYLRSTVSPDIGGANIVEVRMPAGSEVTYDNLVEVPFGQFVWVIEGMLEMTYGEEKTILAEGDCMHLRLDRPTRFRNNSRSATRHAVVVMAEPAVRKAP